MASPFAPQRLNALRKQMTKYQIAAYIVPTEDPHQSEYIAPCHARRSYLSGFTGSAGIAVITQSKAALWTDGRYFLQASNQLDNSCWTLMKSGLANVKTKDEWLLDALPPNSSVGIDPQVVTFSSAKSLTESLKKKGHTLKSIKENLIDIDWINRPKFPSNNIFSYTISGEDHSNKIEKLRNLIKSNSSAWGIVVSQLDEIAWLLNLRGSDIDYNPVFFSYVIITEDTVFFFVDESKFDDSVKLHLGENVIIKPYECIFAELTKLSEMHNKGEKTKLIIDGRTSLALVDAAGGVDRIYEVPRSYVQLLKTIKNEVEIEGFKACHTRDGAALCNYFAWLENELVNKGARLSEVDAADKLESFRKEQDKFVGLSFTTISSTGANGAIIHYQAERGNCSIIDKDKIYLCDSGGQYLDGTTDVTRTMHFGEPTEREKMCNTLVLKGHIAIDQVVFPKGTTGYILDAFARKDLWKHGLDFRHGTGHGVGSFLNVHEGPQGIGIRIAYNDIPLEPGMTITNEPGYYEDNAFGIRIENVLFTKVANTENKFGNIDYLCFENVTFAPIQTKFIQKSILTPDEIKWVNDYHEKVLEKILPLVKDNELTVNWLRKECQPI